MVRGMLRRPLAVLVLITAVQLACVTRGSNTGTAEPDVEAEPSIPEVSTPASDVTAPPDVGAAPVASVVAVVDRDAKTVMLELVQTAKTSIDVFHFELIQSGSVKSLFSALTAAVQRGVTVRVFLDEAVDVSQDAVTALTAAGAQAKIDKTSTTTHLKVMIADRKDLLIGSTNLSGASLDFNHETNVRVRDPKVVAFVASYLDELWKKSNHKPTQRVLSQAGGPSAWVDGGYTTVALPVLDAAKKSVEIIMYGMNFDPAFPTGPVPDLFAALERAEKRGVVVRILLEASKDNVDLTELNQKAAARLRSYGCEVKFDTPDTVTHAKLVVIDATTALVGTNNWGYDGLNNNHEGGVVTTEATAVAAFGTYFAAQWAAAP